MVVSFPTKKNSRYSDHPFFGWHIFQKDDCHGKTTNPHWLARFPNHRNSPQPTCQFDRHRNIFVGPKLARVKQSYNTIGKKSIRLRLYSFISPQNWVYQSIISLSVKFAKSGPSLDPKFTSSLGLLTRQKILVSRRYSSGNTNQLLEQSLDIQLYGWCLKSCTSWGWQFVLLSTRF